MALIIFSMKVTSISMIKYVCSTTVCLNISEASHTRVFIYHKIHNLSF